MTFNYNTGVPATNNNPSIDQPDMLINTQSIDGIINVDHISFNAASGGTHRQITFFDKFVPGNQTDPQSVLYTNNVIAGTFNTASASTVAELFFRNANAGMNPTNNALPISMIKAFGSFDNNGNSLNAWNLALLSPGGHPAAGGFIFTLPVNCVTGTNYLIFISNAQSTGAEALTAFYTISTATQFSINFARTANVSQFLDPSQFSLLVMQL